MNDASPFFRRILGARRHLCQRAAAVVLPNAERARAFADAVRPAGPVLTVWNCPERREVLPLRTRTTGRFVLFYHGSINEARLPKSVIQSLALLPDTVCLDFAGYTTAGNRDYVQILLSEAERLGVHGRVRYLGAPATRSELLQLCSRADVGLAFMPKQSNDINMRAMTGASNKPFDYLACGLNLLVSDLPDWRAMFVEPGYARTCDPADAASIAEAVRWFLDHPEEAEAARASGRQRILDEWNYGTQFAPMLEIMEHSTSTI